MRTIKLSVISLTVFFVLAGGTLIWAATLDIPDLNTFEERDVIQSTKIFDRTGKVVLYDVHGNVKRTVIPFSEISEYVKKATIAIEDANFYEHKGISEFGIIRAGINSLLGNPQGGSTITQQLIKNVLLTSERRISRKIKEAILAYQVEKKYTKKEILEMYINDAPYGGAFYGVGSAAMGYFGKDPADLTIAESAVLAGLPQNARAKTPFANPSERTFLVNESTLFY